MEMQDEREEWRELPGSPNYQVSSLGRVRGRTARNGAPLPDGEWRDLKLSRHTDGYYKVSIDGRVRLVQELVLITFVSPRPKGMIARHVDGDPSDNRAWKLAWGSHAENNRDTVRHGRGNTQRISEDEAWGIKVLLQLQVPGPVIRGVYPSASTGIISSIKLGHTWGHLMVSDGP